MNPDTFLSANPPASYPKKRYYTLDIARAIAIILVAVGHFNIEPMPQFYRYLIDVIYTFHMPLFMFVSGFLCIATMKKTSYMKFISKKFFRLMVPYFVTSVIIIFIKLLTEKVQPVDHPVTVSDFIEILWLPKAGYFLWFVYALWWMMVIVPLFDTPAKRRVFLLISVVLFLINPYFPRLFCLHETARFMIYFASGCVVYDILKKIPVRALCLTSFFAFPVLSVILIINPIAVISQSWLLLQLFILATAFSGI
ncbi:acyltransferase family protein [uncultured Duncaniella sp.]|uniref:acyltransferase family protein n=1 Tax=uncultured Duncaniella sp. TaxID=2768039 RepID=UPI00263B7815|nr:acyltransferase family protein [uncultured Duncaniella sp.]